MSSHLVLKRAQQVPAQESAAFGAIAERFRRGGALERAVSLCREGLARHPDHVSARVTLGWALLDLGRYDEARVELEQALRRAPDNLAAIRGLAELHDRFDQTMHLPMDGPGQWPPQPDAVDGFAAVEMPVAALPAEQPADDVLDLIGASGTGVAGAEAALPPADMGLPIWTAAPAAAATNTAAASVPVPASGMSSVREIDFNDEAISRDLMLDAAPAAPVGDSASDGLDLLTHQVAALVAATAVPPVDAFAVDLGAAEAQPALTLDDYSVSDSRIAALLAEAESLEAAAEADSLGPGDLRLVWPSEPVVEAAVTLAGASRDSVGESPSPAVTEEPGFELAPPPVPAPGVVSLDEPPPDPDVELESGWRSDSPTFDFETPLELALPAVVPFVASMAEAAPEAEAVAAAARAHQTLRRLERMLSRVQARRDELMAQSVA